MEDSETKRMDVDGTRGANIGRPMIGCTVGMEALGSPYNYQRDVPIGTGTRVLTI